MFDQGLSRVRERSSAWQGIVQKTERRYTAIFMQEFGPMNRGFATHRSPKTIALVGKYHSLEIAESLRRLAEYLHERGISVFIERETAEHIGKHCRSVTLGDLRL
jgi:hypothetical protein